MAQPRSPLVLVNPPVAKRERVADGVTSYLRDLILSGQLRAGEPLRTEHLASQLQVSITPIRESLLELFGEGFVTREQHRGYVVAELSAKDIDDLYLVLAMVAGELAAQAAPVMTDATLDELDQLQTQLRDAKQQQAFEQMEEINHRIHQLINTTADARKLAWFAQRASHYAPRWTWQSIAGWPDASVKDHEAVLAALRSHDSEAARAAMVSHMRNSGALLIEHLANTGFWTEPDAVDQ